MRPIIAATTMASLMLAGCAVIPPAEPPSPQAACTDTGLGHFVGQAASEDVGTQMLAVSGAKTLRWGPPGAAMTMDFRPDRLTVAYDENMLILSARCG
jgi:hypothetical protein